MFGGIDDKLNKILDGKVELEHISDEDIAQKISLDNSLKSEQYYDYLEEMEKKFKE